MNDPTSGSDVALLAAVNDWDSEKVIQEGINVQ